MKISAISANQNTKFCGVRKLVSKIDGLTVTKFLSPKGKDLGTHIVAQNGDISGVRKFVDGVTLSYRINYLPTLGTKSYATVVVHNTNPKNLGGLRKAKYYLDTDYFIKHEELRTEKGLKAFITRQKELREEGIKAGKIKVKYEPCS